MVVTDCLGDQGLVLAHQRSDTILAQVVSLRHGVSSRGSIGVELFRDVPEAHLEADVSESLRIIEAL